MPFIQAETPSQRENLGITIISLNTPFATFQAKDGNNIYAVSGDTLMELTERALAFRVVDETQFQNILTPLGLESLESQRANLHSTIFEITLPPLNCVQAYLICETSASTRSKQILEYNNASILSEGPVSIDIANVKDDRFKDPYKITFVVDRDRYRILYGQLSVAFAGSKSWLFVTVEMDPDGPASKKADYSN